MTPIGSTPSTPVLRFEDLADLREVGRGSSATVHRASRADGGEVAVKIFNAVTLDDDRARQFQRERVARERLPEHPCLVGLEARGRTDDGRPFLVLELTKATLDELIDRHGAMPSDAAIAMATEVAGALETAHRHGVVHCDVAPSNIHRAADGWKLADFGSACADEPDDGQPRPFTLAHAAPEAVRGEPGTPARDVYGLASALAHALVGAPPFGAPGSAPPSRIEGRIVAEPVPDLRRSGVPDALCRVIERAMSKDPGRRPTALGLAEELVAAAASTGVTVAPPLVLEPTSELQTRGPSVPPAADLTGDVGAVSDRSTTPGRFTAALVGVAAAALALGAAIPVIADATDSGPQTVALAEQVADDEPAGDPGTADPTAADSADAEDPPPTQEDQVDETEQADEADGGVGGTGGAQAVRTPPEADGGDAGNGTGVAPAAAPAAPGPPVQSDGDGNGAGNGNGNGDGRGDGNRGEGGGGNGGAGPSAN